MPLRPRRTDKVNEYPRLMGPKVRLTRVHGKGRRARPRWRNGGKTIGLTQIEVGHGARRYSAAGDSGAAARLMTGLIACRSARGVWQEIGRASGREGGGQYVRIWGGA